MIVEDERRLAEALGQIMAEQRYQADVVFDGADGLDYALTGQYDAIVLDVMLPKVDGFEVARRLRCAHVSTPILMLTARDEIPDKIAGLDHGADVLYAEKRQDPETKFWKPTGVVRDKEGGNIVEPAYWLGKYSDMPHILSFLNESYQTIFEVLETDNEVAPLLGPFQTAFRNKAMEQLEGMIGTLRVYTSRLATKESYWIFHRDGDDFDLKVSDPKNPSYLLIANDPEMESIRVELAVCKLERLGNSLNVCDYVDSL